ncbi:glycosyltransferase family 4 protein [Acidiphilium multivorum]|uniref:glycosyltransferase family 4 protein n=1 Tax=Acidiphilium multivorum TaxID=62140 RepID=UPI0039C96C33
MFEPDIMTRAALGDDRTDLLFDVTRLAGRLLDGKRPTGIDRVSIAYLRHFGTGARALVRHWGRWVPFRGKAAQRLIRALLGELEPASHIVRTLVATHFLAPSRIKPGSLFFNTGHSGLDDPAYGAMVQRLGLRPIYFLHDLIPITHPEYCRPGETARHEVRLATMLATGAGLVVNSEMTARDLVTYAQRRKLRLPPFVVAPLGTECLTQPARSLHDVGPYFVMLGTIEPRKNHLAMLHLWRRMLETIRADTIPTLVIIGQRGWECEQVIDLLERCVVLRGKIRELNGCDDDTLAAWLAGARALLYPSFVEGFGMPLAEALSIGVPVIASDLAVFHEVAGDIPDYLDPLDGPAWQRRILDYAKPVSAARAAQIARLQHYAAPSWTDHFRIVDDFLASLASEHPT